jgi:hypothetical protein
VGVLAWAIAGGDWLFLVDLALDLAEVFGLFDAFPD